MEKSSAFIFHSSMKGSRNTTAGVPVLHVVGSSMEENREPFRAGPWDSQQEGDPN